MTRSQQYPPDHYSIERAKRPHLDDAFRAASRRHNTTNAEWRAYLGAHYTTKPMRQLAAGCFIILRDHGAD